MLKLSCCAADDARAARCFSLFLSLVLLLPYLSDLRPMTSFAHKLHSHWAYKLLEVLLR